VLNWAACSRGFEIGRDNGERVRVAFALECCVREAMSFFATTGGISGDDVPDLMVTSVEHRFGRVNRLPVTIEWLSAILQVTAVASLATSVLNQERRPSKVRGATEWLKLYPHDQPRLRPRQFETQCRVRDASAAVVDRPLQRGSPAQGSRLSFTP
jgi:hypothetical protein